MASSIPIYGRSRVALTPYPTEHYSDTVTTTGFEPPRRLSPTCCRSVGGLLHSGTPTVCQSPRIALSRFYVHVWAASVSLLSSAVPRLLQLLSAEEQRKATCFLGWQRQNQFVIGRGLLRLLVGGYLNRRPDEIVFANCRFGKPYLADPPWLHFNVSHSHDLVVLGFANDRRLGIDVQKIDTRELTPEVANRVFSPSELSALRGFDWREQLDVFSRTWVAKEAYTKGIGCGLSQRFDQLEVTLAGDGRPRIRVKDKDDSGIASWRLRELRLAEGYTAALAAEGQDWRLKCQFIRAIPEMTDVADIRQ